MNKLILLIFFTVFLAGCGSVGIAVVDRDMTPQLAASLDLAEGVQAQVYSAHNPDVDNSGSMEDIWEGDGLMVYLNEAEFLNISSTSAADTNGSTGAWNVFVICLDENFSFIQELVVLDGLNTVQTVNKCLRPRAMSVLQAGSSTYNEGIISATSATTGNLFDTMDAEESTSKNSHITVPKGFTLVLNKILFSATKSGGQEPIIEFKGKIRLGQFENASWIETFDIKLDTSISDHIVLDNFISNDLDEMTDFRIEVTSTTDNVDVNTRLWWYFVNNSAVDGSMDINGVSG
jgi:hypothetical protein